MVLLPMVGGCAALHNAYDQVGNTVMGMPPPDMVTVTAAAALLPFPWNLVAIAGGGAVIGVWGYLYGKAHQKPNGGS